MRFKSLALALLLVSLAPAISYSQRDRQLSESQDSAYDPKFFEQLGRIFGRFRDADLRRVFESARPIQCSELVTDKGEWREVAFFNENRKLAAWYRTNLEEVKTDLSVYTFKGACGGARAALQLKTEFPIEESFHRFQDGRIRFEDIDVNENAPVSAVFDPPTQAYTFELPYLFRETSDSGETIYTLNARRVSDRYAKDVTNKWECKKVAADDVTYQFLICRSTLLARDPRVRAQERSPSFGASAYSILSDGKEASSSVKLTFGPADTAPTTEPAPAPVREAARTETKPADERTWTAATSQMRLSEVGQVEFRLRFKPEVWKGRLAQPHIIADGSLADGVTAPRNKDYCAWRPRVPAQVAQLLEASAADSIVHSVEFRKEGPSTVTASFEMQDDSDTAIAVLQCYFLQSQTPNDITVARWLTVVGPTIGLETPRKIH